MVKSIDSGLVILNIETEQYYCGYNKFDKQLRKAKIYHSKYYANQAISSLSCGSSCIAVQVELRLTNKI